MAGRIKGITVEIEGNTIGLEKAMKDVNGQARSLQSQLNDVNRLLKFNPGNTTLLAQQQKLLASQVDNTKNKLNQLRQAQSQVQRQFAAGKISEKQYQSFQREIVATEGKLSHFESKLAEVNTALKRNGSVASKLASDYKKAFDDAKNSVDNSIEGIKSAGRGITVAGAGIAAGLGLGIKAAADQERQMAALETAFQGNTKAAKDYYKWAQQYGKTTPFETADVVDATIKLKSYGLEAKNTLGPIGDMAASMGKPLDQAVEAVADAQTGELERLKEFGITKQMLIDQAAKMGKGEIVNAKGQITDQKAMNEALLALMEQRFKGSMERQSKTLYGQLSALKDSITQILQALGNALLPVITPAVAAIQKLVDKFNALPKSAQTFIAIGAALAAAFMLIVGPIVMLIGFLPQIAAGFAMLSGPVGMVIGIVALVVAAIIGLVAIIKNLWATNEAFRNNVMTVWQGIQAIFQAVMPAITSIVKIAWMLIKNIIMSTLTAIKNVISGAMGVIANIIKLFGAIFTGNWKGAWDAIKGLLKSAVQLIWGIINLYFVGKLLGPLKAFGPAAKGILQAIWGFIKGIFTGSLNAIKGLVSGGFGAIKSIIGTLMKGTGTIIKATWNGIKAFLSAIWKGLKTVASSIWNGIKAVIGSAAKGAGSVIRSIWNGIKSFLSGLWRGLRGVASSTWNGIKSAVIGVVRGMGNGIRSAWNGIKSATSAAFRAVRGFILGPLRGISLWNIGQNIIRGLINGIGSMMGALQAKIKAIASSIKSKIKGALGIHSPSRVMRDEVGKMIGAGLEVGMIDSLRGIGQAAQKMSQAAIPAVPGINAPDTTSMGAGTNNGMPATASTSTNDNDTVVQLLIQQNDLLARLLSKDNNYQVSIGDIMTAGAKYKRRKAAF